MWLQTWNKYLVVTGISKEGIHNEMASHCQVGFFSSWTAKKNEINIYQNFCKIMQFHNKTGNVFLIICHKEWPWTCKQWRIQSTVTARPTVAAGKQEDRLHGYIAVLHRCVRWLMTCRNVCLGDGVAWLCC